MTFKDRIFQIIVGLFIEGPAKRQGLKKLTENLQTSGDKVQSRLEKVGSSDKNVIGDKNRAQLRHIIAIERWGQRRIKVALGEPFLQDENHAYKPDVTTTWAELKELFRTTRAETLELTNKLQTKDATQTVLHNQFGSLSVLGWLRYLDTHAKNESRGVR
ncbi:MAG: DinB family protein [Trueperaceae bacterium]